MLIVGLTGSVGMGKSTTAAMFRACGVGVQDADAVVHALYRGALVGPVGTAFPGVVSDGAIDRQTLGARVFGDPDAMRRLEAIVHPAVREAREAFVASQRQAGARCVVLDVPLLLETGLDRSVDFTIVVSAPEAVQRARVLAREGVTPERFAAMVARQMPDPDKRRRAHMIIDTSRGLAAARRQVEAVLRALAPLGGRPHA